MKKIKHISQIPKNIKNRETLSINLKPSKEKPDKDNANWIFITKRRTNMNQKMINKN